MQRRRSTSIRSSVVFERHVFQLVLPLLSILAAKEVCCLQQSAATSCQLQEFVFKTTPEPNAPFCPPEVIHMRNTIYILYDINPPEGFNLRRDVYIRLAVFVKQLQRKHSYNNIRLVLPPWKRLYHWKSSHIQQDSLPWSKFFDIGSLRRYAPVLDFPEFLQEIPKFGLQEAPFIPVHTVFQLLQFEDMFENGVFHDKFEIAPECRKEQFLYGYLLLEPMLLDNDFLCVHFQGSANMLERVLRHSISRLPKDDVKVFAFLNAEIVLHDRWGDREFWRARRSMRFAEPLVAIADEFRLRKFNSTNVDDKVQRPPMWESEYNNRSAVGGAYLCAHLRRGDFVYGREKSTPTLKSAALQIKHAMETLNLTKLFISTDAAAFEVTNLKSYLQRIPMVRFSVESLQQKAFIKDGGIAIIDQLICAHARHFIGTYESTFTYRIYEEREILGFHKSSTFNTLCKNYDLQNCAMNTFWPIVY